MCIYTIATNVAVIFLIQQFQPALINLHSFLITFSQVKKFQQLLSLLSTLLCCCIDVSVVVCVILVVMVLLVILLLLVMNIMLLFKIWLLLVMVLLVLVIAGHHQHLVSVFHAGIVWLELVRQRACTRFQYVITWFPWLDTIPNIKSVLGTFNLAWTPLMYHQHKCLLHATSMSYLSRSVNVVGIIASHGGGGGVISFSVSAMVKVLLFLMLCQTSEFIENYINLSDGQSVKQI